MAHKRPDIGVIPAFGITKHIVAVVATKTGQSFLFTQGIELRKGKDSTGTRVFAGLIDHDIFTDAVTECRFSIRVMLTYKIHIDKSVNRDAMRNPKAIDYFIDLASTTTQM